MNQQPLVKALIAASIIGCFLSVWPIFGQDAIDAVQNLQIATIEGRIEQHARILESMNEKMSWVQGGVAGIFGLIGVIGLFNLKLIAKKGN